MSKKKNSSGLHPSFNTLRVGLTYKLVNHGETTVFEVLEILDDDDCLVRTPDTLETFHLQDLVKFGKGDDFDFEEL